MSGEALFEAQIDVRIEKTRVIQKASEEAQKKPPSSSKSPRRRMRSYRTRRAQEPAEKRLVVAKKAYNRQEMLLQELKSTGGGLAELNRDSINKLEEAFADAKKGQKFIMTAAAGRRFATVDQDGEAITTADRVFAYMMEAISAR
eukprot:gene32891-43991_t